MLVKPIEIFNSVGGARVAYLQNAFAVSYTKKLNTIWTASFRLPTTDEKRGYCTSFNLAKLWDVDEYGNVEVGLFRILPQKEETVGGSETVEYKLEHVISSLLDDVLDGWHEIGGALVSTASVINYILAQQTTQRWVLQECDFSDNYLYGWQDENLLSALLSITKPFIGNDHVWMFDTSVYPHRLSLKQLDYTPIKDIRYRKNLSNFTRVVDPTNIVTVLYPYGYGSGDNKLNISDVNGGVKSLTSLNASIYGRITQAWTDERIVDSGHLKSTAESLLAKIDKPQITYDFKVTSRLNDNFKLGEVIRVVHDDMDETMVVRSIIKKDLTGAPINADLTFGDGVADVSDSMANIIERQRIQEVYAQGAESLYSDSIADNADPDTPLKVTFTIPNNVVHVNEIMFDISLERFRAYSKAAKDGGGTNTTSEYDADDVVTRETDSDNTDFNYSDTEWGGDEIPDWASPIRGGGMWIYGGYFQHQHALLQHRHNIDHEHKIDIPRHRHDIDLEDHEHALEYGIYEGPKADTMSVKLNGIHIGTYGDEASIDLLSHIDKDTNGKVARGTKHVVEITPNDLSRIEATFLIRLFTNSLGAGQH